MEDLQVEQPKRWPEREILTLDQAEAKQHDASDRHENRSEDCQRKKLALPREPHFHVPANIN